MIRYLLSTVLTFIVGAYFGIIVAKARQSRLDRALKTMRDALRRTLYTGQTCVECGNGKIYPSMCDSCGASWKADMHLEGSRRKQKMPLPGDPGWRQEPSPPPDDVRGTDYKDGWPRRKQ